MNVEKLEEITTSICMQLNILHNAIKDCEWEDLDICAVSCFVEDIYNKSKEIGVIFLIYAVGIVIPTYVKAV